MKYKNTGFTLLEILITTFIFSFAMLSLALMQMNGMKAGHSASLQSIANMQTMDILERMRANRVGVLNGNYNIAKASSPSGSGVAITELINWRATLANLLPEGDSAIVCNATGRCTINIYWKTIHADSNTPDLNFRVITQI